MRYEYNCPFPDDVTCRLLQLVIWETSPFLPHLPLFRPRTPGMTYVAGPFLSLPPPKKTLWNILTKTTCTKITEETVLLSCLRSKIGTSTCMHVHGKKTSKMDWVVASLAVMLCLWWECSGDETQEMFSRCKTGTLATKSVHMLRSVVSMLGKSSLGMPHYLWRTDLVSKWSSSCMKF